MSRLNDKPFVSSMSRKRVYEELWWGKRDKFKRKWEGGGVGGGEEEEEGEGGRGYRRVKKRKKGKERERRGRGKEREGESRGGGEEERRKRKGEEEGKRGWGGGKEKKTPRISLRGTGDFTVYLLVLSYPILLNISLNVSPLPVWNVGYRKDTDFFLICPLPFHDV